MDTKKISKKSYPLETLLLHYPQLLRIEGLDDIVKTVLPSFQTPLSFKNKTKWSELLKQKNLKLRATFEFLIVEIAKRFQKLHGRSPGLDDINHILMRADCVGLNHLIEGGLFDGSFNVVLIRAGLKINRDAS